jgi:hypothetical protein
MLQAAYLQWISHSFAVSIGLEPISHFAAANGLAIRLNTIITTYQILRKVQGANL